MAPRSVLLSLLSVLFASAQAWRLQRWLGAACVGLACSSAPLVPLLLPAPAHATTLAEQLASMQAAQDALDAQDVEWTPVEGAPKGVLLREYRQGKVNGVPVSPQSKVTAELVVRMKTFRTQNDPGGVRYYSTKIDAPKEGAITWMIGDGSLLPSLEQGMTGMTKGSLRRIEVPSTVVFAARKANQLPLPSDKDEEGQRRFARLFKADATLIFEVLVRSVEPPAPADQSS